MSASVCLSVCLYVSDCLCLHVSVCVSMSVCLSVCPGVYGEVEGAPGVAAVHCWHQLHHHRSHTGMHSILYYANSDWHRGQ